MNQQINIGVPIDLQKLLETRLLIQANSGGGKSVLARVIMEESVGKVPFIVLDCDGEYYTLKEKFGDVVVIGDQFADLPISMQAIPMLPREIISNQLSVIIDLSSLKMPERIRYVKLFLETMMELPKQYWLPYLVFLEEVHKFCGEQDKQESGPAVRDLMSRGRKMGFCGILITQRISKLHKDAAAEVNNKFVGRTNLDIDMDRAAKELGFSGSSQYTRLSLRDLKPGHFYAFGVAIEPHHVHEVKIKMPLTQIPKAGNIIDIKPKKPTAKLLEALNKLNELPQTVRKEQQTMQQLQAEVIRLQNELKKSAKPSVPFPGKLENTAQISGFKQQILVLKNEIADKNRTIKNFSDQLAFARRKLETVRDLASDVLKQSIPVSEKRVIPPDNSVHLTLTPQKNRAISPNNLSTKPDQKASSGSFGKCARSILAFLASMPDRSFTKAMIGIACGYSPGSGGFNNALSELTTADFIVRGDRIRVNNDRMAEIMHGVFHGELITVEYNIETFKSKLGKCEREIYEVLLENPEVTYSKEILADATETGYSSSSGGFNNAISRLNTLELITRTNGSIKLNPELLELM